MVSKGDDLFHRAAMCWNEKQPLEAGRLIFENLPTEVRPSWAASVLRLVLARSGIHFPVLEQVLHTADHEDMWKNGHRVFSTLRAAVMNIDEVERARDLTDDQKLLRSILSLAELVAKVTYNATHPPDEFDEDSGWWIAACLRGFVDHRWKDKEFSNAAWSTLCCQGT